MRQPDNVVGETLRIAFSSVNSGYPSYSRLHRLDVRNASGAVGTPILGLGTLTVTLPDNGLYIVEVRAINGQSTGWYAFQLDRLDDPAGADRMALDWELEGSIPARAGFAVYTLRAEAGSDAELNLACVNSGYPSYSPLLYAELLDAAGGQVAYVNGSGPTTFTFGATGVYTLFIAAHNWESTGWYTASLACRSWPFVPCDTVARSSNYASGVAGTNGVPTLTTSAPPVIGTSIDLQIGNCSGTTTTVLLLTGLSSAVDPFTGYSGNILVAQPTVTALYPVPPAGTTLTFAIPNSPLLRGLAVPAQTLVIDAGAPFGVALSRGLMVLLG